MAVLSCELYTGDRISWALSFPPIKSKKKKSLWYIWAIHNSHNLALSSCIFEQKMHREKLCRKLVIVIWYVWHIWRLRFLSCWGLICLFIENILLQPLASQKTVLISGCYSRTQGRFHPRSLLKNGTVGRNLQDETQISEPCLAAFLSFLASRKYVSM